MNVINPMNRTADPFTVEVIRNALTAIAEEMTLVIMRSARSPLLREAGDLSSALTDATTAGRRNDRRTHPQPALTPPAATRLRSRQNPDTH